MSPFDTIDDNRYGNAAEKEFGSALLDLMDTSSGWSFPIF
jgi:hypothetical protein